MSGRVTRSGPRSVTRVELLRDLDRPTGRVLLVEGVEQSYVDDVDPTHLEFEYMQHIALVLDEVRPGDAPLSVVHLGAGALTLPRWISATRPGSRQLAVELAEDVVEVLAALAPVACELRLGDAVDVLEQLPAADCDVVIWDLYDGPRAVTSALTLEAVQEMHRVLRADGVLLLNVSDATPFDVVRPVLAALKSCFDDVCLLAEPSTLRGRRSGNCVLVADVGAALPHARLARAGASAAVRASVLCEAALVKFIGAAVPATVAAPLPPPDRSRGRAFL